MHTLTACRNACAVALLSLSCVAAQAAPTPSLPMSATGAPLKAPVVTKAATTFQLASTVAARTIVLPAPTAAQLATLNTLPLPSSRAKRTAIGLGRPIPSTEGALDMATLKWQVGADGSMATQVRVESTGAAGVRVALRMQATDPDVVIRVAGSNGGTVFGPYPGNQVAETTATLGEWWTPALEGSAAIIEVSVPPGYDTRSLVFTMPQLSHLTRVGAGLAPSAKVGDPNLGTSGTCETNWSCAAIVPQSQGLINQANSVARILFTEPTGDSFLCSGTLLADSTHSSTPYFFTAAHCMDNAYAAQTTDFYWFFDAPTVVPDPCQHTNAVGQYYLQASGAFLLGISVSQDWALIRINSTPPSGTHMSAWSALPISSGVIQDLHHPSGDTKKYSAGNLTGYVPTVIDNEDTNLPQINDDLMQVIWNQGVTEGGSSGSGLLTYDSGTDAYTVHGALTGGESACEAPTSPDVYSRLDQMLPVMRDYLTPDQVLPNTGVVIEYYNASLDDYFMTQNPVEINALDTGDVIRGWVRTGLRFLAYTTPQAGTSPVCRFYLNPPYGSSHFYSAALSDCQALISNPVQFPGWTEETTHAFYINTPDAGGNCPANTSPVWRFYNGAQINHRFTTDISIHDTLIQEPDTWAYEGVKMCALNGS